MQIKSCRRLIYFVPMVLVCLGTTMSCRGNSKMVNLFGGQQWFDLLTKAERIEAYRLESNIDTVIEAQSEDDVAKIASYPIISEPVTVNQAVASEIVSVLHDESTYDLDIAKPCIFEPGVAVRFTHQSDTVDVLFCFSCNELEIYVNGKSTGQEFFDRARLRLIAVFKQIFPNDSVIQSLK